MQTLRQSTHSADSRRSRRPFLVSALLAGALASSTMSAAPAFAAELQVGTAAQQRAVEYWTPERMANAELLDRISLSPDQVGQLAEPIRTGAPVTVPPTAPTEKAGAAADVPGARWSKGGKIVPTSGRVFFTYNGKDSACSGNVVTSSNRDVVLTAGHCVKLGGNWHTNWVFAPAYADGATPYGKWPSRKLLATPQWVANEQRSIGYDIGTGVLATLDNKHVADVVGTQGVAFNQARKQVMHAFGFPAAAPYDGKWLIYCSGTATDEWLTGSGDVGLRCNMTGGASGGPWFLNFNESTGVGTQNSVNSFKYVFDPNSMYGPYFGADGKTLYDQAQAA